MRSIIQKIQEAVQTAAHQIKSIDLDRFERKPSPLKWSKKEILGHLCDSAQNNIQRFIRGQYEASPKIFYHQDEWVKVAQYQDYDRDDLLQLWIMLNKHLCNILKVMPSSHYENKCDTGNDEIELYTLKYLAEDYLRHMNHHLAQITE